MPKIVEGEQRMFMTGNEVAPWAALAAGADIMYGYPITPQTEIMHYWAKLAPKYGKKFMQTEDELSAGFTTLGGCMAGKKAFSGTAGPGNTLMQEPISMAEMMRIPAVWFIQQRGGPSTATVIYSQQETRLTTFGGNGEGYRIVYSTSTHQEVFDYGIKAFNTAWKYRFPTFILGDGYQGKMREPVTLYNPEDRGITLVPSEPFVAKGGVPGVDRDPSQLRNTFNIEEELYDRVMELQTAYDEMRPEVEEWQEDGCAGADLVLIAHGVVVRAIREATTELRKQGYKVGYFRPITLRPMPSQQLRKAVHHCKQVLVVESAQGQLASLIKDDIYGETTPLHTLLRPGVGITKDEVVEHATRLLKSPVHA